ncbi:MAG: type III-B CRISPR-associated protein Cas10/Cmr2 [Chloroflexota bacterium]
MPETALAIFTFSPVQSFISEARRAEDLFNGSAILSRLACAAAKALDKENLIYPDSLSENDMPNKLVARLPLDQAAGMLEKAENALIGEWRKIAEEALQTSGLTTDEVWVSIWQRQVIQNPPWQVFWVYQPETGDYTADFREASRRLDALKHSRLFTQSEEEGEKDSLSGQRSALHTNGKSPKKYWAEMAKKPQITASQLKPEGKERLDSIGLIKRFAELAGRREFPSTSTVAGWDFYQQAKAAAGELLKTYSGELENLKLHKVRPADRDFPYDLDLFFKETLTVERMKDSYGREFTEKDLAPAKQALKKLVEAVGFSPSPYYAILLLDGDGIGRKLDRMEANGVKGEDFHRQFSKKLGKFAEKTAEFVKPSEGGFLVYNGGDDVLLLASLQRAIPLASSLAQAYQQAFSDLFKATLSGAVLIAHHLSPLSRVLADLRKAEKHAKSVAADELGNKDTLCLALSKRGGEPLLARSPWILIEKFEEDWVKPFREGKLANSMPYLLREDLRVAEGLDEEAVEALVCYRFKRQAGENFNKQEVADLSEQWIGWVATIEEMIKKEQHQTVPKKTAFEEAVNGLIIARFLAQGGKE